MSRALLLILDGWGHSERQEWNAIAQGEVPYWRSLWASQPRTLLNTSGHAVGLPEGQMGNSEVGHMNMGAGRVVYTDYSRVSSAIEDGSFQHNEALRGSCEQARASGGALHVLGLLSPGGVHSHEDHLFAMIALAREVGVAQIAVHAFLDGRDVAPRSAEASLQALQEVLDRSPGAVLASVGGRYWGMDRDRRWERVERAWHAIVHGRAEHQAATGLDALAAAYARDQGDEFVEPTVITPVGIRDGDAVVFMNFRSDRARQFSQALVEPGFDAFDCGRRPQLSAFATLTQYQDGLPARIAYRSETPADTIGEIVAERGLRQLRIAETEKYAHVTFFFSGGREQPFAGEERILVPSPKVATYDLQPQMSAPEVTSRLVQALGEQRFELVVCNLANPDMVGHSGIWEAALEAVRVVDGALERIIPAARAAGYEVLLTADHGNIEMMRDPISGAPFTQHTTNPVPLLYIGQHRDAELLPGGALKDIAPTLLGLMGIPQPPTMDGRTLLRVPR